MTKRVRSESESRSFPVLIRREMRVMVVVLTGLGLGRSWIEGYLLYGIKVAHV